MTKERALHLFDYDRENGLLIWKNPPKNHPRLKGRQAGRRRNDGYLVVTSFFKEHLIHELIWMLETGEQMKRLKHLNGDKLDNRFANLRERGFE